MSDITVGSFWKDKDSSGLVEITEVLDGHVRYTWDGERCGWDITSFLQNFEEYTPVSKKLEPKTDMVNHPPHYKDASGVGCTEVVKHMMYFGGACFKYLYRCGNKWDDVEDLKKAVRCAELADDDRFITDESWLRAMYQVASHREGNIRDAMFNIRSQQWEYVIEYIKAEIARLEANQ